MKNVIRSTEDNKHRYIFSPGYRPMYIHDRTDPEAAEALYSAYTRRVRVRIWFGDTETGRAWGEELDTTGRVSLSMGPIRIPILLANSRSTGGGGILDHCIVKIQEIHSRRVLYQHPDFDAGLFRAHKAHNGLPPEYTVSVDHKHEGGDWANVANFRTWAEADRYTAFMTGRRFTTGGR